MTLLKWFIASIEVHVIENIIAGVFTTAIGAKVHIVVIIPSLQPAIAIPFPSVIMTGMSNELRLSPKDETNTSRQLLPSGSTR